MPVATSNALPLKNYATGTYNLPATTLPDWVANIHVVIARNTLADSNIWPDPLTTIRVEPYYSMDGGTTWIPAVAFDGVGGRVVIKGVERATMENDINVPAGVGRQFKADVMIGNGPLRTKADITLIG